MKNKKYKLKLHKDVFGLIGMFSVSTDLFKLDLTTDELAVCIYLSYHLHLWQYVEDETKINKIDYDCMEKSIKIKKNKINKIIKALIEKDVLTEVENE